MNEGHAYEAMNECDGNDDGQLWPIDDDDDDGDEDDDIYIMMQCLFVCL